MAKSVGESVFGSSSTVGGVTLGSQGQEVDEEELG
jgi:hypothetical protein